jgi:hypothetical protein
MDDLVVLLLLLLVLIPVVYVLTRVASIHQNTARTFGTKHTVESWWFPNPQLRVTKHGRERAKRVTHAGWKAVPLEL